MKVTYADAILLRADLCAKSNLTDSDRLLIAACNAVLYGSDAERTHAAGMILARQSAT
jgi:hypothetical protein